MNQVTTYPITNTALRWLETVLAERYGHEWHLDSTKAGIRLQLVGAEAAILFDTRCEGFTQAKSDQPFTRWDAEKEGWVPVLSRALPAPGVTELPSPLIEKHGTQYLIHYDILGLTYWMLARVEEVGRTDLDSHGRFPAAASHAFKHGYLNRPVVDEWLDLLRQVIQRQWPRVKLKRHKFNLKLSHDVDQPSLYAFKPWRTIARMMVSHAIKSCNFQAFFAAAYVKLATKNKLIAADPFNTFDWLMDVSEQNNLQSAFYFICGGSNPLFDADYDLEHPVIRNLLRRIYRRGHEIGLHPSYDSVYNSEMVKKEAIRLKKICDEEGIEQEQWGGRMHYLRWQQPRTPRSWASAGLDYDATLGYADHPGFRCGTCIEFCGFDAVAQQIIDLRIRPLIIMECTLISNIYLALGEHNSASEKIKQYINTCAAVGGQMELLWHNSDLVNQKSKSIYVDVVTYGSKIKKSSF